MKNNKKGDRAKIEIELLLQKALRVQQEPSQQLYIFDFPQKRKKEGRGGVCLGVRDAVMGFFEFFFSNIISKKKYAATTIYYLLKFLTNFPKKKRKGGVSWGGGERVLFI